MPSRRGAAPASYNRYHQLEQDGYITTHASSSPLSTVSPWVRVWLAGLLVATFLLFAYLPMLVHRNTKPTVFVWPQNQSRQPRDFLRASADGLVTPEKLGDICSPPSPDSPVSLLVIVCSALDNTKERQTIRDTWAGDRLRPRSVRVIFLLGQRRNESSEQQEALLRESAEFGDLLQVPLIDSYANLTLKSLHLLSWYSNSCARVPYVLKTDDDMYINLLKLTTVIEKSEAKEPLLLGTLICGAVPIRDGQNKWYCPEYMYNGRVYPNYLSGTGYVISNSAAKQLMSIADSVPLFHLEDIYITGMLAKKANIRPRDHVGFSYLKQRSDACVYSQVISSHHLKTSEMERMAAALEKQNRICPKFKDKKLRSYGPGKCKW